MIRRFARPYARAVIDVAGTPQKANNIRAELARFEQALASATDLQEVYANPGIDLETKFKLTHTIANKLGLSELSGKVLEVLIRNHRINDISAVIEALAQYINDELGIAVADVRSAAKLSEAEVSDLRKALEKKVGKRVEVRVSTDPSLLGGFVAKIGSEVYDASIVGKIHKFREKLS
jgi:F-type H+-transporting ATPase subunit delta